MASRTILDEWEDCIGRQALRGKVMSERERNLARLFFMQGALSACSLLQQSQERLVDRMIEQAKPVRMIPITPPPPEAA